MGNYLNRINTTKVDQSLFDQINSERTYSPFIIPNPIHSFRSRNENSSIILLSRKNFFGLTESRTIYSSRLDQQVDTAYDFIKPLLKPLIDTFHKHYYIYKFHSFYFQIHKLNSSSLNFSISNPNFS